MQYENPKTAMKWSHKYPGLYNNSLVYNNILIKLMSSASFTNFSFFPSLVETSLQVVHLQCLTSAVEG